MEESVALRARCTEAIVAMVLFFFSGARGAGRTELTASRAGRTAAEGTRGTAENAASRARCVDVAAASRARSAEASGAWRVEAEGSIGDEAITSSEESESAWRAWCIKSNTARNRRDGIALAFLRAWCACVAAARGCVEMRAAGVL